MLRAHNKIELDFLMLRAYIKMSSFEGKNFPHPQHSKKITIFFLEVYSRTIESILRQHKIHILLNCTSEV